jgi:hypothetical protein
VVRPCTGSWADRGQGEWDQVGDSPPNQSGAPPSGTGQAAGSIMALDPVDGEPAVVVDHVDAFAPFDVH